MIRSLAIAVAAAALYVALGYSVSHAAPFGIDVAGRALVGHGTFLALVFTESCWWEMLLAFGIIMVMVAIRHPEWRARIVIAIPTTLITWQLSDVLKNLFRRPRPEYWQWIHEPTFSYSSGHAMFALLVYGLWAWFVWNSDLPYRVRVIAAPLLALWACGVVWSRLALGAHYVTDLVGGILLGTAMLALASAVAAALRARARAR